MMDEDDIQAEFDDRISAFIDDLQPFLRGEKLETVTALARRFETAMLPNPVGVNFLVMTVLMKRMLDGLKENASPLDAAVVIATFLKFVMKEDDDDEDEDEEGNEP